MSQLAFIPARAGSIGIKNKNLRKVGGISLIRRTYDQAFLSEVFTNIIISTNSFKCSYEIFPEFKSSNYDKLPEGSLLEIRENIYLHKRESHLSQTLTPIVDVIFTLIDKLKSLNYENLWMLQPTSPFRSKNEFSDIKSTIDRYGINDLEWSSIVSCKLVLDSHPDRMFKIVDNYAMPVMNQKWGINAPRQILDPIYLKDGGYYVTRRENLINFDFLGNKIIPFIREDYLTINIDSIENLVQARKIARFLK